MRYLIKNGEVLPLPSQDRHGAQMARLNAGSEVRWRPDFLSLAPQHVDENTVGSLVGIEKVPGGQRYWVQWPGKDRPLDHSGHALVPHRIAQASGAAPIGGQTVYLKAEDSCGRGLKNCSGPAGAGWRCWDCKGQEPVRKAEGHQWQGRAIAHPQHVDDLNARAAVLEFKDRLPRDEAERRAHQEYGQDQHAEAAAHHLRGSRAAQALGDQKAARKHFLMYSLHLRALGADPVGPVPEKVQVLSQKPVVAEAKPRYAFGAHRADALLFDKGEPGV